MCDMGTHILNFVMTITTIWIVKRFWGSFFEKRKNLFFSTIVWGLFCIYQIILQYNSGNLNVVMTIINALLILAIVVCGYQCKGKEKYFLLIVFCAVWALLEIFTFFLISGIQINEEGQDTVGNVVSKLLMVIFVYVVSMIWNKKYNEHISNNLHICLFFIPLGSIYIAVNQYYSQSNKLSSTISISILLLFNIVILEIYIKINELFIYEKERIMYAQQLNVISYSIFEQKKIMENFHEEKHNLINELIVLKDGIEKGTPENAITNLNKIINNCNCVEIVSNSGNTTVDAIINFKYAVAKEYGIKFCLKIFIPDELPIPQCDIGVVIGNAIDNAIEAVRVCKNKEKIIEISMSVKKEAWIMIIKNPYEHEIKKDRNGHILSTKKEKYRHGYGLKSIMRIAAEYQGEVLIDVENNIFCLTIVMNFRNF